MIVFTALKRAALQRRLQQPLFATGVPFCGQKLWCNYLRAATLFDLY
jgi:hypothetical protein